MTVPRIMLRKFRKKRFVQITYTYVVGLAALALLMLPLVLMFTTSLKSTGEILGGESTILPQHPTLSNFTDLWKLARFRKYLLNSLTVSGITAFLTLIFGSLAAYSLSSFKFRGRLTFSRLILIVYMFPPILLVIPFFVLMYRYGLYDTHISLVIAYTTLSLPFCTWMLMGFFKNLPKDIEDAALIDGCSKIGILIRILIPLSLPALVATGVFSFMLAWSDFIYALTFINSDNLRTLSVGIHTLIGQQWFPYGLIMAGAVYMAVPICILFLIVQRLFIVGLSSGAVKG